MISGEVLEEKIKGLLEKGIRNNLISRGLARILVWKDGELPPLSPRFATDLSADLLEYGYTLLRLSLLLREEQGENELVISGFERSAEAIEAVIRRGNPTDVERGFDAVVAACAYHLGHFSARSYCLLPFGTDLNLTPAEHALFCLLRRSLDDLNTHCREWLQSDFNSDTTAASRLVDSGDEFDLESALNNAATSAILRAISIFDFALTTGSNGSVEDAINLLRECEDMSSDLNLVTTWWISKLAKNLVSDLWGYSLHEQLPKGVDGSGSEKWPGLRELFIARLRSKKSSEIELWPSQVCAAQRTCDVADDLIVSLPTSAGKTRVAELCVLRTLAADQRVVYVTPLRALSAQVERDLREMFQSLGFTISALYGAAGAVGIDSDTLGNRSIVVATPEKLDFAIRQQPELLNDVGLIVLDEAHMIGPEEREVRYEVLVQRLLRRTDAANRRLVCLSAILPRGDQLTDFVSWIRQGADGEAVLSDWRPTRQRFGTVRWKETYARLDVYVDREQAFIERYVQAITPSGRRQKLFPADNQELTLATAWRIVSEGGSALIFCPKRRSVGALAKNVLRLHQHGLLKSLLNSASDITRAKRVAVEWLSEEHPAVKCLDLGVAVHHAGLPKPFLREIEILLRARKLPVIISSPTLAQGLNLSASSLLMYDLRRKDDLISGEEFANVIGRAGRAGIDIEGQVLYVLYEPTEWRLRQWKQLVNAARHRQIQSGLATLVGLLSQKITAALSFDLEHFLEYVANNTNVWEQAIAAEASKPNGSTSALEEQIGSLDSAILALIEDHDISVQDLPVALDMVLQDSLWVRTLAHATDSVRLGRSLILQNRARYIWENSTGVQRRGYFAAGVSFRTGRHLDEVADILNAALFNAESFLDRGMSDNAIASVQEFAEVVFTIRPFAPKDPPPACWRDILAMWLRGEPMNWIVPLAPDNAVEFIEDGIVYRLVWATEAVRVRSKMHEDQYADLWTGRAAEALEAGTMLRSAAILLQAGLGSRAAALAAIKDIAADFTDYDGMREWLRSPGVKFAAEHPHWPTPETSDLWRTFMIAMSSDAVGEWGRQTKSSAVNWDIDVKPPSDGTLLRVVMDVSGLRTDVYAPDFQRLGRLKSPLPNLTGVAYGTVAGGGQQLDVCYLGPGKLS